MQNGVWLAGPSPSYHTTLASDERKKLVDRPGTLQVDLTIHAKPEETILYHGTKWNEIDLYVLNGREVNEYGWNTNE